MIHLRNHFMVIFRYRFVNLQHMKPTILSFITYFSWKSTHNGLYLIFFIILDFFKIHTALISVISPHYKSYYDWNFLHFFKNIFVYKMTAYTINWTNCHNFINCHLFHFRIFSLIIFIIFAFENDTLFINFTNIELGRLVYSYLLFCPFTKSY